MENNQVVSIGILSYRNYEYLKEAVDSVLIQTYPYIQLIISNDASEDFDEEEIQAYIEENKRENIVDIIIYNQEMNQGTVRNVNYVRKNATGEFLLLMAADDALNDETVIQRFVNEFNVLGEEAYIISAKTAMCGESLEDIKTYVPDKEGINAIKNLSPAEMFSKLSYLFIIPTTSTCYRMSLYDIVGPYDEEYFIIEDAPLYLRIARNGIQFHWIDNFVAARHRGGGISHGNKKNSSESYRKYRYDEVLVYKKEILPHQDLILPSDKDQMLEKWEYIKQAYDNDFSLTGEKNFVQDNSLVGRFKRNNSIIIGFHYISAVLLILPCIIIRFRLFDMLIPDNIRNDFPF